MNLESIHDEAVLGRLDVPRPQPVLRFLMVLAMVAIVGCTRREGMNFECAWPSDAIFSVDLGDPVALRHLLDDIRLAEELGIPVW